MLVRKKKSSIDKGKLKIKITESKMFENQNKVKLKLKKRNKNQKDEFSSHSLSSDGSYCKKIHNHARPQIIFEEPKPNKRDRKYEKFSYESKSSEEEDKGINNSSSEEGNFDDLFLEKQPKCTAESCTKDVNPFKRKPELI